MHHCSFSGKLIIVANIFCKCWNKNTNIIKEKIRDLPHRFVDWICNSIVILFALWCNSRLCRRPLQSRHLKNLVDINGRSSWYRVVEGIYGIFREDFWHVVYYLSMVIAVYWLCELNRWSAGSDYKSYIVVVMAIWCLLWVLSLLCHRNTYPAKKWRCE